MKPTLAKYLLLTLGLTTSLTNTLASAGAAEGTQLQRFSDLTAISATRQAAIGEALQLGFLTGDPNGYFRPYDKTTRQEIAFLLVKIMQLPLKSTATSAFKDVSNSGWAASSIEAVNTAGFMSGDANGKFRPQAAVTLEELAVILERAVQWQQMNQPSMDSALGAQLQSVSKWARSSVSNMIQNGVTSLAGSEFRPKRFVERQELAELLLEAFVPKKRPSVIQHIEGNTVQINGMDYSLSSRVKNILRLENANVLQHANIRFTATGRTIERITFLEITQSGKPALDNSPEFSGNVVLDGKDGAIDGHLKVSADYVTVRNVQVSGQFEVSSLLEHDFYSDRLTVGGKTLVRGGDSNTVVFENASLGTVDINKQNVRVETIGGTKIGEIAISSNASLLADSSVTIPKITLQEGAAKVELQGSIGTLEVASKSGTVISGAANIEKVDVSTSAPVNLNVSGNVQQLAVNNPGASVSLGSAANVAAVSLGANVPSGVVSNSAPASTPAPAPAVNQAPTVERELADRTIERNAGDATEDITGLFNDPDNDKLTIAPLTSNRNVVKAALTGNILKLTPVASGTAVITIRVTDGKGHVVNVTFNVTVIESSPVNQPPVGVAIPAKTMEAGSASSEVELSQYFSDPENEALTYTVTVSNPSVAGATVTGSKLTLTPLAAGTATVEVTAKDGHNATAVKQISVTVTVPVPVPVNQPPVGVAIPAKSMEAGSASSEVELSQYFSDPENEALTYTVKVSNPSVVSAAVAGSKLTLTPLTAGNTTVEVTAKDGHNLTAVKQISITVTAPAPVNQPPVGVAIPAKSMEAGSVSSEVELSQYFSDPENEALTYTVTVSNPSVAGATVTGSKLTLTPLAAGTATVEVTAKDGHNATAVKQISVTVTVPVPVPVNQPPVGVAIPAKSMEAGSASSEVELSQYFSDPENEALTYTVKVSNPSVVSAAVAGSKLTLTPLTAGNTTVEVTAKDGHNLTAVKQISITVTAPAPVNQPPVGVAIPAKSMEAGSASSEVELSQYFSDPENEALTYTVTVSNPSVVSAAVAGSKLTITPLTAGNTTVEVTAKDGHNLTAVKQISITVTAPAPVNQPPVGEAIPAKAIEAGSASSEVELAQYFSDPESETLTYEVTVSDPQIASAAITDGKLTITPLTAGTATIEVTAKDSHNATVTKQISVTVTQNQPPVGQDLPSQTLEVGEQIGELELAQYFSDPESETLTYEVTVSDPLIASAAITDGKLTITPLAAGTTTVEVTAKDGHNATAAKQISVTVTQNQPPVGQDLPSQTLEVGEQIGELELAQYFSDPESETLTYEVTVSDPLVASAAITDGKLTITPLAAGTTTVEVTAKDGHNATAAKQISVTVTQNQPPVGQDLPSQTLEVGEQIGELELSQYFSDPESEALTYEVTVSDPLIASATITDGKLTITPLTAGTATIEVTAKDSHNATVPKQISVTVTQNQPPVGQDLPSQTLEVGEQIGELELAQYFSDPESETLTYEVTVSDPLIASAAITDGKLTITPLAAGTTTVEVTAKDGHNATAAKQISVTVTQNQPPVGQDLPSQTLEVGEQIGELELSQYFSDPESEALTYEVTVSDPLIASATITDGKLTITPLTAGTATIEVTAKDSHNATVTKLISVTVTQNQPPVGQDLPSQTLEVGEQIGELELAQYFSDPESETLTYEVTVSDPLIASATITDGKLTITPLATGTATVEVTAKDSHNATVTKQISVTVTQNQPPVGQDLPSQTLEVGEQIGELELAQYFSDPESEALTYEVTVSDPLVASAAITDGKLTITPLASGTTTVEVTAKDSHNATATKQISLTVTQNQAPVGQDIPSLSLETGAASQEIDLSQYFTDPESEPLTYEVSVSDPQIAGATITGGKLTITPLAAGTAAVEVTAKDSHNATAAKQISVTVVTPTVANSAPEVVAAIQTQVLSASGHTQPRSYDLSQLFSDADGDTLTYSAVVGPDSQAVQATIDGSTLTLAAGAAGHAGTATVAIKANDGHGHETTYNLTVQAVELVPDGFVEIRTKVGVPYLVVDLASYFPNETGMQVYFATESQTLMGPTPINGKEWRTDMLMNGDFWVVGAGNKAVLLRVQVAAQNNADPYFMQYIDGGDYSKTIQIKNPLFGTGQKFMGYSIEIFHYNPGTNATTSAVTPLFDIRESDYQDLNIVNTIDRAFYEYFDVINSFYYNAELILNIPGRVLTAIVLKKGNQVIDVIGNPTGRNAILANGGTIIRKQAIHSASQTFSLPGEWNLYPKGTYNLYSQQTP
ncbi:Ig-like domain-containing protein [Paenibacillus silvisoli]|uniref:Ig-like domain-containing protein n=1 Tax=Paenibacillus silvisoli TaxID=3110539 RepID=UPI002805571B|nr:Ig-like domain-containing protein [Paenibacillus silvisoli]